MMIMTAITLMRIDDFGGSASFSPGRLVRGHVQITASDDRRLASAWQD
jgi:hypothetical protein